MELSLPKRMTFALVVVIAVLAVLEGVLAAAGVRPVTSDTDPFVGFAGNLPLFTEQRGPSGELEFVTSTNKSSIFNSQSFAGQKADGSYRIFALGGSTTYGRPYSDPTSFVGWLREYLPAADRDRNWEVINAGGISYASYRIAALMEELAGYEPDLFIIYTGHNEFLEDRTYGELRRIPGGLRSIMAVLARTRIWTAVSRVASGLESEEPTPDSDGRSILPQEVQAKLDHSAGPALYHRDDEQADDILGHYRVSLERSVRIAREAGAEVIFVTPASNLKDCTPFKSQPSDGLDAAALQEVQRLSSVEGPAEERLAALERALTLDPRNADLLFANGKVLLEVGRHDEAESALIRSRDEDVCPLRAPTAFQEEVREIAREQGVVLVDYPALLREVMTDRHGHSIAGEELFLDHVHPTIEGHRLLALALLDEMASLGIVGLDPGWNDDSMAAVADRVEAGIDPAVHANALANLSLTLNWAGKNEESRSLAAMALESGYEDPTMLMMVGRHAALDGDHDRALEYFRRAVRASPNSPVVHSQIGMLYNGMGDLEAAAAHIFLASLIWNDNDVYHKQLATVMSQRGRMRSALRSLRDASRLKPADQDLVRRVEQAAAALSESDRDPPRAEIDVTRHESGFPRTVAQTAPGPGGAPALDGIWTEWYASGALKSFADYRAGKLVGAPANWSEQGDRLP